MCFCNCKFIFQQWGQFQLFGTQPIGLMPAEDRSPHWWRTADDGLNNQRISAQTEKLAYLSVNTTDASTRLLSITRSDFRWLTHVFDGLFHVREAPSSLMIDLFMQMASCWWRECCLQRLLLEVCSGGSKVTDIVQSFSLIPVLLIVGGLLLDFYKVSGFYSMLIS